MSEAVLLEAVFQVRNTADIVTSHIHSNPDGLLDELLERIQEALRSVQNSILNALRPLLDRLESIISGITNVISSLVARIVGLADELVDSIWANLWDVLDVLFSAFRSALDKIRQSFLDALDRFRDWITELRQAIKDEIAILVMRLAEGLANLTGEMRAKMAEIGEKIRDLADRLVENIKSFAKKVTDAIITAYHTATEKISEVLRKIWERIRAIYEQINEKIGEIRDWIVNEVRPVLARTLSDTGVGFVHDVQALAGFVEATVSGNAAGIRSTLHTLLTRESEYDYSTYAVLVAVGIGAVLPAISAIAAPALEIVQQEMRASLLPGILDPSTLAVATLRGAVTFGEAAAEAARAGYSSQQLALAIEAQRELLPPGQAGLAYLRGEISEGEHDAVLRKHGYTDVDIKALKALYWLIPPPTDLIRMAVKEAFSPEIAERFGQYEDYPTAFTEWAKKQGISEEWARRYWASHWDLPSPQMGFEMLHRGIIDVEELKLLLRALDVMPYWRERLIQLSYNPYTRVDVRRMYQTGVLSADDVYKAYRDLGYDDEKARNLTEFTLRYYTREDETELDQYRTLTRSIFITAYKRGLISKEECVERLVSIGYHQADAEFLTQIAEAELALKATDEDKIPLKSRATSLVLEGYRLGLYREIEAREMLENLGYSENEIDWYVYLTDWEHYHNIRELEIETVHQRYVSRAITKEDAVVALGKFEITASELERRFDTWEVEREARTRKPTEAQFRAALYAGLITKEEYLEEVRGLGYSDRYAQMLLNLALARKGG